MTIEDFFEKLVYGEISSDFSFDLSSLEKIKRIEISQTPTSAAIQASQDCNIIELLNIFGTNVYFYLDEIDFTVDITQQNKEYANSEGKEFITSLTETIWYIDMRGHDKLENRGLNHSLENCNYEFSDEPHDIHDEPQDIYDKLQDTCDEFQDTYNEPQNIYNNNDDSADTEITTVTEDPIQKIFEK
ncbi:9977_t:CDS:2, partial [Racocetra persica]